MAKQGLNNQWQELLRAGTDNGETYTTADLDKIVHEYSTRQDGDKAPVGLGSPEEGRPEKVGHIGALRRAGKSLEGKFSDIDPRAEHLYGRGVFPKKSVQIERSPTGDSLQRVGLIAPIFHGGVHHDKGTPALDDLMKQHVGMKNHVFKENGMADEKGGITGRYAVFTGPFTVSDSPADAMIAQLKGAGYWSSRFDRAGITHVFHECPHLAGTLCELLRSLIDKCDPNSELLSECAQYRAHARGVSFSEALTQISQREWAIPASVGISPQQREIERDSTKRALDAELITQQMYDLAWQYANAQQITFKQAMTQVSGEHPDWFSALAAQQVDRMHNPMGLR